MKQVQVKSGLMGWQGLLQEIYANLDEFESYCMVYQTHVRLGYKTVKGAWRSNPTVQGSVNPSDLRRVRERKY